MSPSKTAQPSPACFRIVDLFAGPGGLDVAADALGHEVTGIEWDPGACETRKAAGLNTFKGDVRTYRAAFFPRAEVLTGGPPCQTFTVAGHGAGRRALDKVLQHIESLHKAVLDESLDWPGLFRVWRDITETLRRAEVKAAEVRAQKRKVEELRTKVRKALRQRLTRLGHSAQEVETLLKELRTNQLLDLPDDELKGLLKEFTDLDDEHVTLKERLEELGDERTGLVLQPLWWVIERSKRPGSEPYRAVILEQVPAVLPVWKAYAEVLASLGYRTMAQPVHTEAFGVPQTRRRAILMARLDQDALMSGAPFEPGKDFPEVPETHHCYRSEGQLALSSSKEHCVSMETALKRAKEVADDKGLEPHQVPRDRAPFTVVSNYGTGGDPKARGRRHHDAPAATVTGKVSRNRVVDRETGEDLPRFTFAEAGVLQTFPVSYPWRGNDVSQQIGNAVPPLLALHVLRHVLGPGLVLNENGVDPRLERDIEKLETWLPSRSTESLTHKDLKHHPLAAR